MKHKIALITVLLLWGMGVVFTQNPDESDGGGLRAQIIDTSGIPEEAPAVVMTDVTNNEFIRQSTELNTQAEAKYEEGDYDAAVDLFDEASRFAALSDAFVQEQLEIKASNDAISNARERLVWAAGVGAEERYPDEYTSAFGYYTTALDERRARQWIDAKNNADRVGIALANVKAPGDVIAEVKPDDPTKPDDNTGGSAGTSGATTGTVTPGGGGSNRPSGPSSVNPPSGTYPAQYTVRSWYTTRDCLWNIASWPWVYGDATKWTRLYNANRDKLPEPENPDLILPDMVLDIPSLKGEIREGMWSENIVYQPLP
ncbi:hypothetical protein FACS1894164_06300 [Spirochaetia bacterium]|nr:hypothetical protein FACS1894164_06300 [Spirochaetia bacterium]